MRLTKTLLTGATALSLLAGPALAQQGYGGNPQHNGDHGPMGGHQDYHSAYHQGPSGPNGHWARGDHYNGQRYVIAHGDWNRYHLRAAPPGYEWVRSGNQFVMIAITSGIIASIIAGSAY